MANVSLKSVDYRPDDPTDRTLRICTETLFMNGLVTLLSKKENTTNHK